MVRDGGGPCDPCGVRIRARLKTTKPAASRDLRSSGICLAWEVGARLSLKVEEGVLVCAIAWSRAPIVSYIFQSSLPSLASPGHANSSSSSRLPRVAERCIADDGERAVKPRDAALHSLRPTAPPASSMSRVFRAFQFFSRWL